MKKYLDLLRDVLENGEWKESAREGMPRTKEVFNRSIRLNLQDGFPLLTTKKVYFKGVIIELLWFLRGDDNIRYLVNNNVHIWDSDAYKFYKRFGGTLSKEDFIDRCTGDKTLYKSSPYLAENISGYKEYGRVGNIYGHQWRRFGSKDDSVDQISYLIHNLLVNPNSRYHLVSAWNPNDFISSGLRAALPACHVMFQCNVRNKRYLDISVIQRSCDVFLGVPFNLASYAALTHILAFITGYLPGELIWTGQSVHIYENHMKAIEEQLLREPRKLPKLSIEYNGFNKDNPYILENGEVKFDLWAMDNFVLKGYNPYPPIKAPLSVGV